MISPKLLVVNFMALTALHLIANTAGEDPVSFNPGAVCGMMQLDKGLRKVYKRDCARGLKPQGCDVPSKKFTNHCLQKLPTYCKGRLVEYQKKIFDNLGVSGAGDITKIPDNFPLHKLFSQHGYMNSPYENAVREYVRSHKPEFIFDDATVGEALLIFLVVEDSANNPCKK